MIQSEKHYTKTQEMIFELKISDAMKKNVIAISPETPMSEFGTILREHRISGTPVMKDDKLIGVISIEDYIKWLKEDRVDKPIGERMSLDVRTIFADEPLVHAVSKLEQYGYGRIPVLDRTTQKLVGIITRGAVIEGLLRELEIDYHEDEVQRYQAKHVLGDFVADRTILMLKYNVEGHNFDKGGQVASGIKKNLGRLAIHPDICRRTAIAAYEAEMNVIIYADNGEFTVQVEPDKILMKIEDMGPGIPDIEKALEPGFSTAPEWVREMGFGAGMGLSNIKKCADSLQIASTVGKGTTLEIMFEIKNDNT